MIREDLVASAVTFLQDPGVASSPLDKRISFLQSKNLTQEEIDSALARAGEDPSAYSSTGTATPSSSTSSNYAYPNQQVVRQPPPGLYGPYQQGGYWPQQQPPEPPRRDWRDWFIMATVSGGVGYGLYFIAKRYIYPLIAPPTPPQLEQDKKAIDDAFAKAFALLDQLNTDTETLKASEEARTERLDTALKEVETVVAELKRDAERRENESRKISEEIKGLRSMIPKAMDTQKESTDARLKDLNGELRSLKTLVGNRMSAGNVTRPAAPTVGSFPGVGGSTVGASSSSSPSAATSTGSGAGASGNTTGGDDQPLTVATPASPVSAARSTSTGGFYPSGTLPTPRAAIPAWQMAAASKSTGSVNTTATEAPGSS